MKKVVIIGASQGIGREIAKHYINDGAILGIASRKEEALNTLREISPQKVFCKKIDASKQEAILLLEELISSMGGMDTFIYCAGTGFVNKELDIEKEITTIGVNVYGFTLLMDYAFNYFSKQEKGHLAVIASVAGIRTLSICPAYCSSKRFNIMYMKALSTLAKKNKKDIRFTTIMPGFIDTALIENGSYPMVTSLEKGGKGIYMAIEKERRNAFVPTYWGFIAFFMRLIPNFIWRKII
ncbi:MAG: SDR family NAD(P)-dependent oxidoreductase [Bacteroidales bacterium]|jgi:short-subunit dehydrogenase|nr:SDR family NAD(P)-dependent oxidoreductase [Bacteroidales bacterium]